MLFPILFFVCSLGYVLDEIGCWADCIRGKSDFFQPFLGLVQGSDLGGKKSDFQVHLYEKPCIPFEKSQKVI